MVKSKNFIRIVVVALVVMVFLVAGFTVVAYFANDSFLYSLLEKILTSLVTALAGALIALIYIERNGKRIKFANELAKYGFENINTLASMKTREILDCFANADELKIFYVSGKHFFEKSEVLKLMNLKRKNQINIKILVAKQETDFLTDIESMEHTFGNRYEGDSISSEIDNLVDRFGSKPNVEIRGFRSQYRLPIFLAKFNVGKPNEYIKSWLTVSLPPYKSTVAITLRGYKELNSLEGSSHFDVEEFDISDMIETHFDAVWDKAVVLSEPSVTKIESKKSVKEKNK